MEDFVKYLGVKSYIDGFRTLGRDVVIINYQGKSQELSGDIPSKIAVRVDQQLKIFKFWHMRADGNLYFMPDIVIEEGKKIGYKLAYEEIVNKKQVTWGLLLDAVGNCGLTAY